MGQINEIKDIIVINNNKMGRIIDNKLIIKILLHTSYDHMKFLVTNDQCTHTGTLKATGGTVRQRISMQRIEIYV